MSYERFVKVVNNFFNTLLEVWKHFECSDLGEDEEPYPFEMWLEDLRTQLADLDNEIYEMI